MPHHSFGVSPGAGFMSTQTFTELDTSLGNVSNNLSSINLPQDSELDMSTFSQTSQKSEVNTSFDVKKFSSRLCSHMSALSDGLPFSDIEDVDDLDQSGPSNTETVQTAERTEFVKPSLQVIREKHAALDGGVLFLPPDSSGPRSVTPKPHESDSGFGGSICENSQEITPTKPILPELDPLTPTANLKVLLSAASPEIRNREKQLLNETGEFDTSGLAFGSNSLDEYSTPSSEEIEALCQTATKGQYWDKPGRVRKKPKKLCTELDEVKSLPDPVPVISRKEKSLGLLCQRFLALYPELPDDNSRSYICLDAVALHLNVERRRIYDIVNVLESVDMVSRVAKNKYAWHGKTHLVNTLYRLKVMGIEEKLADQLEQMERANQNISKKPPTSKTTRVGRLNHELEGTRKDKSLGLLSEKFLSLFLVSQPPRIINLDMSAKILIGDPFVDKTEAGKFKTKIRRLYDIANILTSLDLIEKVHVTETRGRKPAFQYVGPDPENLLPSHGADLSRRLHVIPQEPVPRLFGPTKRVIVVEPQEPVKVKQTTLKRHSSLDQICRVAESERERLYFQSSMEGSSSASMQDESTAILRSQLNQPPLCVPPSAILDTSPLSNREPPKQKLIIKSSKPQSDVSSSDSATPPAKQTSVVTLNNDQLDVLIKQLDGTPPGSSIEVSNDEGHTSEMKISGPLLEALKKARHSAIAASNLASSPGSTSNVVKQVRIVKRTVSKSSFAPQIVNRPGHVGAIAIKREMSAAAHTSPKIPKTEPGTKLGSKPSCDFVDFQKPIGCNNIKKEKTGNNDEKSSSIKLGLSPLRPLSLGDPYQHMPRIPSMDIGLPSPLPASQGSSGLNTPTLPQGFTDEKNAVQTGNSSDVFTFPPPPPSEQRTRSLPSTPTMHLSCTSSPVMILPARSNALPLSKEQSSGIITGDRPNISSIIAPQPVTKSVFLTPQSGTSQGFITPQSYVSPGFLTPKNGPTGLITPGSGAFMLCPPTMSPLAPFTSTPTAPFLLPNGMMFTPTDQKESVFSITPTLNADKVYNITPLNIRPTSGIAPSSGKIMNLMSLFSTPPAQIISSDTAPNASPVDLSITTSPVLNTSPQTTGKTIQSESPGITEMETGNVPDKCELIDSELKENLPDTDHAEFKHDTTPVTVEKSMNTLKTPAPRKLREVATPGTFFRGTPQGMTISNVTSGSGDSKSAFSVVKSEKVLVQANMPVRRLALVADD